MINLLCFFKVNKQEKPFAKDKYYVFKTKNDNE